MQTVAADVRSAKNNRPAQCSMNAHSCAFQGRDGASAATAVAFPASQIEAYRLEYRGVFGALNALPEWDDDCSIVAVHCERLKELEALICKTPSANRADAEAKLRYACEIAEDGMVLDADDAADLMRDVAKHLIAGGR